ncbi:HIT domain-containing protein [Massilia oculi]|uniref:HIT domain-containing protein n=1 Tax=Massilia hydrophila TaxID=3044279 RepID=A0ABS7YBG5_9BURK|nr:HIT domain-containing protein [Massilia oculi]MCA1857036.1 HIT domain-containing protein [Massilia oculi]
MDYDNTNPFARILRGELPCVKVYEDALTLAIMDIMPQAPGHVLVLPKEPAAELFALSDEGAAACIRTTKKVAAAVKAALGAPGIMIAQFNGSAAGQTVPHVHFHIVPREGAAALLPHAAVPADGEQLRAIATRIVAALGG